MAIRKPQLANLPIEHMVAIDPGGQHTGWAEFTRDPGSQIWRCVRACEHVPDEATDRLGGGMLNAEWQTIVIEEFRLYPDKAMEQTGSTMPTCEQIGAMKFAHRLACRHYRDQFEHGVTATDKAPWQNEPELVMQPAAIQTPTAAVLRARGIKSAAKRLGAGPHARSAELHGWHWIIRTRGEQGVS